MKRIIFIVTFSIASCAYSQVAIGKAGISNNSVSLEFGDYVTGEGKGIIVPWVESVGALSANTQNGTIVFDVSDKLMKYKKAGAWFNLSKNEMAKVGNQAAPSDTTGAVDTTLQGASVVEKSDAKVSIGTPTSEASNPGILVLEDNDKAMVLPKVPSPHLNIVNPEPGLMVYDTTKKQLAIFNGKVWNFWKP